MDFLSEFIVKKKDYTDTLLEKGLINENDLKTCVFLSKNQDRQLSSVLSDHIKDEEAVLTIYAQVQGLEFLDIEDLELMDKNFDKSFASASLEYFCQKNPIIPFKRLSEHELGCLTSTPDDVFLLESIEKFFISTVAVPMVCTSITMEVAKEKYDRLVLLFTSDDRGKQRIQYLCNHCDINDVPFMISVLKRTDDAENMLKIINTLGRMRKKEALGVIEKYLSHPDTMIRSAALVAKSKITGSGSGSA